MSNKVWHCLSERQDKYKKTFLHQNEQWTGLTLGEHVPHAVNFDISCLIIF